jgi:toxin FitB
MNVVDSSAWLEYFINGKNAEIFEPIILDTKNLIVPTITIYEVFKKVIQQKDETQGLRAIAIMQQGTIFELTSEIALNAAKISMDMKLPMADSIILASARQNKAILWTQDDDFKGIDGIKYFKK